MKGKNLEKLSMGNLAVSDENAHMVLDHLYEGANPEQQRSIDFLRRCYLASELSSFTDDLTGLGNRKALKKKFREEYSRINRNGGHLAVVELDIDYFKKVNDEYGHDAGDDVLKRFSDVISKNIRASDGFYRYGGEEFYLILPIDGRRAAHGVVSKLREKIQEERMETKEGKTINMTFSSGIYLTDGKDSMESSLKKADAALYDVKENGRNQVGIYYENRA